jgi:hypothetical protein
MPAFKALLQEYFSVVETIDSRDWKESDSEPYDVTVFDFRTTPIEPAVNEVGADGKRIYKSAKYLRDDFSKPTVFIASTADEMGRSIGLKLDWLCLCLDADAHHINSEHAIFKGPLENVVPTMVNKPTPDGIYQYPSGQQIPREIPMWRVDQVGYLDNQQVRIGLVSRGGRFDESPDTERISSGVFLWGFGASPAEMTDEGKKVFVNTVAYMAQFDGRIPVARKYNDRMATTDDVREGVARVNPESYTAYAKSMTSINEQNAALKKKLEAKKSAGETLTKEEELTLQYAGYKQEIESFEDFLKRRMGKLAGKFGSDYQAYQDFMQKNMDYIYCDPEGFFTHEIDEDVQQIGIPNHDVRLLDYCVEMLRKNDRPELASRVLARYTDKNFSNAKQWSEWLDQHKDKLFFSETNGYKFTVDTYSKI